MSKGEFQLSVIQFSGDTGGECRIILHVHLQRVTQGDEWDTQKDMAYALAGACIALLIHGAWHARCQSQVNRVRNE